MSRPVLQVVCGIAHDDPGGTGRFLRVLLDQARTLPEVELRFFHSMEKRISLDTALKGLHLLDAAKEIALRSTSWRPFPRPGDDMLLQAEHVLMLHPQTLRYAWCEKFLRRRRKPTWMYVLDASFFCIRSYNHIPGESSACLRCLGGDFSQARAFDCPDFPCPQKGSIPFLTFLRQAAARGEVRFLSQSANYDELLRRHFGPQAVIKRAGMCADFETGFEASAPDDGGSGHIVFHGAHLEPKGAKWALDLARACPDIPFLFPFAKGHADALGVTPANAVFQPMTWETGLREAVRRSRATLCPSLWSAPVEGALVKSIIHAPVTAVAATASAFSATIPDSVVLKLSEDPLQAARELAASQAPSREERVRWYAAYAAENSNILHNIYNAMALA